MSTDLDPASILEDGLIPGAFAHVFQSSPLGLCIVNADLSYVEVNQTWCSMLGYERDELTELSFLDVTFPEDREIDRGLSERLFAGNIPYFEIDKRWVRKDGSLFHGRLLASVLHKKGSEPWGIGMIEEISPTGESTLVERDRSLVGQLAPGVAHDLNNILMIIASNSARLQKQFGEAPETRAIATAVDRAAGLCRSLLVAGKAEARTPIETAVRDSLKNLDLISTELVPAEISIRISEENAETLVSLSPVQLDQVLMNLVLNARDAITGTGSIEVFTTTTSEAVTLHVSDTGVGISKEIQAQIFRPFFSTKPPGRGNGMGLAIVADIAERAGGRVSVESEPGAGSTFSVILPHVP